MCETTILANSIHICAIDGIGCACEAVHLDSAFWTRQGHTGDGKADHLREIRLDLFASCTI